MDPALLKESETWPVNDYGAMAGVYDEAMGADIAAIIAPMHTQIMGSKLASARVLDVCCGTGSYLRALAHVAPNAELVGIDLSTQQIAAAKEKGRDISYVVGDATQVEFPGQCDFVTMNLDTMNHLRTPEDWETVQGKIYRALKPDGLFLFDINTQKRLARDLNFPEVIVKSDMRLIDLGVSVETMGEFIRQTHLMLAFKRMPDDTWREHHARIQHIAPSEEHLYQMLGEAGFSSWQEIPLSEEERGKHIFLKNRLFIKARK